MSVTVSGSGLVSTVRHVVAVFVDSMRSLPVAVDSKVSVCVGPSVGVHSMVRRSTGSECGGWCVEPACSRIVSLPSGVWVGHSWAAIRSGRPRRSQCRQVTSCVWGCDWLGCSTDSFSRLLDCFMLRALRSTGAVLQHRPHFLRRYPVLLSCMSILY